MMRYRCNDLAVARGCLLFMLLALFSSESAASEPDECDDDLNDYVLPCFVAYSSELQPFHHEELAEIASDIEDALGKGLELELVIVNGFGVFFRPDDPAIENSEKRARNVSSELFAELRSRGIEPAPGSIIDQGLGDPVPRFGSTTQKERWLLRRVEVFVSYREEKEPTAGDCEPDDETARRLESFNKDFPANPGKEHAVRCMAELLRKHYMCEARNDSDYLHLRNIIIRMGLVQRFEKGRPPFGEYACGDKKGRQLKRCLSRIDRDIVEGLKPFHRAIQEFSIEVVNENDFLRLPECRYGRWILNQHETPDSIYSCYPAQSRVYEICR